MQGSGSRGHLLSEINVTPLVDVMLVLLIIFMVTAPMMMQGVDVKLPETSAPASPVKRNDWVVNVSGDRKIYINEYPVEMDALGPKLAAIYRNQQGHQGIFLRADENIPYGFVVQVMATIREAGIDKIGMVTEPLKSSR